MPADHSITRRRFIAGTSGLLVSGAFCEVAGGAEPAGTRGARPKTKTQSTFYPPEVVQVVRTNVARHDGGKAVAADVRAAASPWVVMSDGELWSLMFGATLPRSWMVWSDGHCPACAESVPMYNWQMDGLRRPWKAWCPHCQAEFPTNDFAAFYRSGLDARGVFDPAEADRALLFHAGYPNPDDPQHRFGVDDGHGYAHDGMNLGLFACGLDMMTDFGYPPVQFGGWGSPRARWYGMSAAHNTVVVDGTNHASGGGRTTLWADGGPVRAIRASAAGMIPPGAAGADRGQFERTIVAVDMPDPARFYVLDIFRVVGGRDHTKFMHSQFASVTTAGLALEPGEDYGHQTQMRNFRCDTAPQPGWSVDWQIEDRFGLLPAGKVVHLQYTDLTLGAQAALAEGWISYGGYGADARQQAWIPRLAIRRQAPEGPLDSLFAGLIEPYGNESSIASIRRLPVTAADGRPYPEATLAVEVTHQDGTQDLILAADVENPLGKMPSLNTEHVLTQRDWDVALAGELCLLRRTQEGRLAHVFAANAASIRISDREIGNSAPETLLEWNGE